MWAMIAPSEDQKNCEVFWGGGGGGEGGNWFLRGSGGKGKLAFESRKSMRDTWFLRRGGGAHEFQTLTPLCEINGFICKNPYRQAGVMLKVSTRPHQQWWERVCVPGSCSLPECTSWWRGGRSPEQHSSQPASPAGVSSSLPQQGSLREGGS